MGLFFFGMFIGNITGFFIAALFAVGKDDR